MGDSLRDRWSDWAARRAEELADRPWLLSKYEVSSAVTWPPEKVAILLELLWRRLALAPGARLVEVCCGSGWLAAGLAARGARAAGIDFAPQMVAVGRRRFPDVDFLVADAAECPLRARSAEAVLCFFALMNIESVETRRRIVAEAHRLLRPGGRALIGHCPLSDRAAEYDAAKARYLARLESGWEGAPLREEFQPPIVTFAREELLELGAAFRGAELLPSFNHFWFPGEPSTCEWRVDLYLRK